MPKYLKFILIVICFIASVVLLSPVISLILPEKLTNHTYYRLLYKLIADKETKGCATDEEKLLKLFHYVVDHEFHQGAPYKCKPAESLIYGEAYCDFKARTLNSLLGVARIQSRYAMLIANDNPDVSCHTLNEVNLDGKWRVVDSSIDIIFKDSKGNYLSLKDMSDDFDLISNERKFSVLRTFRKNSYDGYEAWFRRMFPIVHEPQRSTPCMLQEHLFDHIADIYFKVFKYPFFNTYQDIYLKFKKKYSGQNDFKMFFIARNYHLAYRYGLALKYYNILFKSYPESKYIEDAVFFLGMLYFDMKDYPRAIEFFKLTTEKYSKWKNAGYYYLGRAYALTGDDEAAFMAYSKVSDLMLPAQVLEGLKERGL